MKERIYKVETVRITYLRSDPPKIAITATGLANTSGWTDIELLPIPKKVDDGIYEFELVGTPPSGASLQVLTEVHTTYIFEEIPPQFKGVVVYAKTNSVRNVSESRAAEATDFEDSIPRLPWKEVLKGISVKNNELTIRVPSNGCTKKEDFQIDINKGITGIPPFILTVFRLRLDYCKAIVRGGTEITYTFEELGLEPGDSFHVTNDFQQ